MKAGQRQEDMQRKNHGDRDGQRLKHRERQIQAKTDKTNIKTQVDTDKRQRQTKLGRQFQTQGKTAGLDGDRQTSRETD